MSVVSPPNASPPKRPMLDHLAIGVERWSDAYDRFVHELGGSWAIGGPAGEFAPCQLFYGAGMRLEFIAPTAPGGFMERFLQRHGPSAHHITFKVPSLRRTVEELARLGLDTFGDRPDLPMFRELFIHPKQTGLGTLLQLVEVDDEYLSRASPVGSGRPHGFPVPSAPARELALFGLTVPDLQRANDLLGTILQGTVTDKDEGWFFITWGAGHSILVRRPDAAPCDARWWAETPENGVGFVLFGSRTATAADLARRCGESVPLPPDPATGIPVWLAAQ